MTARDGIPAPVVRRRFAGLVCPLPSLYCVAPGCIAIGRISPHYAARTLCGLVFRFSGKRRRAGDVRNIEIKSRFGTIWRADAELARMLDFYREGAKATRRYVFIDFSDPWISRSGLRLDDAEPALYVELEIGRDAIAPVVHWWAAFQ